jgi:hypothetical protein
MKMRAFGNLMNRVMESSKQEVPQVGMGATVIMYSDRHAATIVAVKGNRVAIQKDKATRMDNRGMCEQQDYIYEPNKQAKLQWFSKRKNSSYVEVGSKLNGTKLVIGYRDGYHDYSF